MTRRKRDGGCPHFTAVHHDACWRVCVGWWSHKAQREGWSSWNKKQPFMWCLRTSSWTDCSTWKNWRKMTASSSLWVSMSTCSPALTSKLPRELPDCDWRTLCCTFGFLMEHSLLGKGTKIQNDCHQGNKALRTKLASLVPECPPDKPAGWIMCCALSASSRSISWQVEAQLCGSQAVIASSDGWNTPM